MDQRDCYEDMLDSKTGTALSEVEKSTVVSITHLQKQGNHNSDLEIATQTPEKISESLYNKSKEKELNLPERHKTLLGLFDCMTYSLRLLSLCKRPTTFLNICSQVEVLRKSKLSYTDLARMKYALPEALEINKILVHDMKTLQMRPELQISLLLKVVEGHQEQSDYKALHKVFAAKLMDIAIGYPEDIPLANLPEPFNQNSKTIPGDKSVNSPEAALLGPASKLSPELPEAPVQRDSIDLLHPEAPQHDQAESSFQGPSLSRYFSKKVDSDEDAKYELLVASPKSTSNASSVRLNKQHTEPELVEEFCDMGNEPVICAKLDIQNKHVKESQDADSQPNISNSPLQMKSPITAVQSPALGIASSDILMTETPAQIPPKRSVSSCDEKLKGVTRLAPHSMSAKRSLVFSHGEGEVSMSSELHSCRIQNDCTSQTPITEGFTLEESVGCHHSVDRNVNMGDDPVTDECKRSSCLSELVPIIHQIFLSVNRAAITQEELVHKILVDSVHIVERREVEVHIELLEKRLPDWLCKRSAPFGGFLYYIKKAEALSSIQARLAAGT